ncbi:MAG: glycerol kinase GlpK [Janthinobacterium lividum]
MLLAIDQGTTSTRSILFDGAGHKLFTAQSELPQHYPAPGWVEHDAEDIWRDTLDTARKALAAGEAEAIGITNQRETVVLWDRATGRPVHRAIVWQDRRTAEACAALRAEGAEPMVQARTGLLLDPYFSATKLAWLLDHVNGARAAAMRGALAFGTVDSFLLWRLTGGAMHATDATNASRTLLFDIHRQCWDEDLLRLFGIPASVLPEVRDSAGVFGWTAPGLFGRTLPIAGIAGDQQAALAGQACLSPGMMKATYGTGCFALCHTGDAAIASSHRMLTTVASRLSGRTAYAIEGAIFVAGAAVQWLRDGLGVIGNAAETAALAQSVPDSHGVYLVPGFVGLGAPHWRPEASGLLTGLTLGTTPAHLARAALEAVAYQTLDLVEAMRADAGRAPVALRVDGGMTANDWMCQFLADILDVPVERPAVVETTAWGAALLAGVGAGLLPGLDAVAWAAERRFSPAMDPAVRQHLVAGWQHALARTLLPLARS